MKRLIYISLMFIFQSFMYSQNNDYKALENFLIELKRSKVSYSELFESTFYSGKAGEETRTKESTDYYLTSVLPVLKEKIQKNHFSVVKYNKISEELKSKYYSNYYDGQVDFIYLVTFDKIEDTFYCLMFEGKIVSLMPDVIQDNQILSWK